MNPLDAKPVDDAMTRTSPDRGPEAAETRWTKEGVMTTKKLWAAAALAVALTGLGGGRAGAVPTTNARLTIDVSVNANLSVKLDGVDTSTRTDAVTPGGTPAVNSGSTITVTSDATGVNEFWKLSSANAPKKLDGSAGWTLATSTSGAGGPSTDQFALQALFVSSNTVAGGCPAGGASDWDQARSVPLSATPQTYTKQTGNGGAGRFAHPTDVGGATGDPDINAAGANDGRMRVAGKRGLCYRIIPPSDVTFTDNVLVYLTVTASLTQ